LKREVAIKLLSSDRLADEGRRRRFIQEAQAASDGGCVILERQGSIRGGWRDSPIVISALDPIGGRGAELGRAPAGIVADNLLPDGDAYAFILDDEAGRQNRIRVLSFTGDPPKDIIVRNATNPHSLDWLSSGSGFFSIGITSKQNDVLFITPDGTSRVVWSPAGLIPEWALPSRDGKHLAVMVNTSRYWSVPGSRTPGC
jgi:hypothetical protein